MTPHEAVKTLASAVESVAQFDRDYRSGQFALPAKLAKEEQDVVSTKLPSAQEAIVVLKKAFRIAE